MALIFLDFWPTLQCDASDPPLPATTCNVTCDSIFMLILWGGCGCNGMALLNMIEQALPLLHIDHGSDHHGGIA
jgi:hypothetical protein